MRFAQFIRRFSTALILAAFVFLPTAVHAAESTAQTEGGLGGAGIVIALLALILILLGVVAVIGAVALGIIGIGYTSIQGDD